MSRAEADSADPRYMQLGRTLKARIEQGTYGIGDLLPTEIELCDEFDVSRYTVREALRMLTNLGLVRRRQGSGTQIIATHVQDSYVHSMRSLSELFQYATNTSLTIDAIETAVPEPEFSRYFDDAGSAWLRVEGIRLDHDGKTPICASLVFINNAYSDIAESLANHTDAVYRMLERRFGVRVDDVEQVITACRISKISAKRLAMSSRTWVVRVVRRYVAADGTLLIVSVNDHPADRFSYTMHLRREGPRS